MKKQDLDTPCLTLDAELLKANLHLMAGRVSERGKALRPHAKTHKCTRLAQLQIEAGAVGVCAATLYEAEGLVRAGLRGTLLTSPVVGQARIARLTALLVQDPALMVVVDDAGNARALGEAAVERGLVLNVLVDIDPGMGRTGVAPELAPALAQLVADLPGLRLAGVQCYAGHIQHIRSYRERRDQSLECLGRAAAALRRIRDAGLSCPVFTGAGTGTFDIDCEVPELTDLQAGSYVFMDSEYMNIGSAEHPDRFTLFRPALTLLATVVSANQAGFATIDAGHKALFPCGSRPLVFRPEGANLRYEPFGDEHGKLVYGPGSLRLRPGERVEMMAAHCDPTINLFDTLFVTRGDNVVDVWPIDLRGYGR